jgi:uncharacterized protein (DUF427 family)
MCSDTVKKESVWEYPRPPRLEPSTRLVRVIFADRVIAQSQRAFRILETSHPPTYYIPPEDVNREFLVPSTLHTFCEFKGQANYLSLKVDDRNSENAGWYYANPAAAFATIRNYISFYASRVDICFVDGERVQAQPGDFYGGWITSDIEGPFKGNPDTKTW